MAGSLMLVNPRKRKSTKRRTLRRNPDAPRKRRKRRGFFTKARDRAAKSVKRARRSVGRVTKRAVKSTRKALRGGRRSKRKPQSVMKMIQNPMGFVQQTVLPAAIGSAGALALDVAYAYLPIPANIKNGPLAPVVKIGVVGLLGATAAHFVPQKMLKPVHTAVTASIIIIAYGWLKNRVAQAVPQVRLGEFLEDETICPIPGVTPLSYYQAGQFIPDTMGEYVSEYVSGDGYEMDGANYHDDDYADMIS